MEYRLAKTAKYAKPSLIRQVFDFSKDNPDFISFSIGNPAPETIPLTVFKKISEKIFEEHGTEAFSYGSNSGYLPLRKAIRARLVRQGIPMAAQEVLITPGSGHGIDLMAQAFCEPGDEVLTEEYTYTGMLGAARLAGCALTGIKMEEDGMDLDALEAALKSHPKAKYIYLVSTFSNPTGLTWSLHKRKELYRLAQLFDCMIYEDDPYRELRFTGEKIPSVKSLDVDGRVVYGGSFSKTLSAGLRVGYVVCHRNLYPCLSTCQGNCVTASNLSQMIVAAFIKDYDYDAHIESVCSFYEKKAQAMKKCLDQGLPASCQRTDPEGGLFLWVTLPPGSDTLKIWQELLSQGVGVVPSVAFAPNPENPGLGFRLNYSFPSLDEIQKGSSVFCRTLKKNTPTHCPKR